MANELRILVAEDDKTTREAWRELIGTWGFKVQTVDDGMQVVEAVQNFDPHILLLDLKLPGKDGITVLRDLHELGLRIATIVISGEGDFPDAVQTIKLGAYDHLRKPIDPAHLCVLLNHLSDHINTAEENQRLRRQLIECGELGPIVGQSLAIRRVMRTIEEVAPSSASVLIVGESGTGKELVARTIHELSSRRNGPYVAVNCAALPETLMESELLGHERGAFTGAERRREGCFEMANRGTLLLDEITEMRVELQAKLLRVIEDQKLRRLGGTVEIALDVRLLAASNRNLAEATRLGRLREDLYYRLNVFTIELPPLRDRLEDISALVEIFIRQFAAANGKSVTGVDNESLEILRGHRWPGNVRQLRNVIERATIVARGPLITAADLPADVRRVNRKGPHFELRIGDSLDDLEREFIFRTLEFTDGNKVRAAEILGISLKTLYNRLGKYLGKERAESA
ncbi:MAG: sigma-54 dependent transcriptional regulator [Candidatus Binatus sp.]|uniref:sigma-54-dependent transcriptional regulator n=1 Tax=Candidatus Binatus sp. TaxID=2811406 RepID=UPI0027163475|nr:sigma-54 dependent transcriptional regulator [Candidatus Binatus sp.]MDO8431927.1 sigma-54 dependent transcriptional regulator [Candidatus Binatus sp.]